MDKTRREKDEWKIIDWRVVAKDFFPLSRLGRFVKKRVPQIFAIWAGVAALLRIPLFVSAFGAFGRNLNSPFFTVGRIGPNQSVDITAAFLIGLAAISVDLLFMMIVYGCIKISRGITKRRPVEVEQWAGKFAGKMTDEVSSILTHCSAATLVLLVNVWPEIRGTQLAYLCAAMAALTFVFGAVCYRES
ncbi:MAG: hypothetical protein EPN73_02205 [Paraburkholderia sp.]|uniref:hypothetical protein n=1 Tax=Paraburkholderia sp. TaxID=1926495 RepID=UPI00121294B4|nr:hypothetical protein [Paraburkholderia sp.]TAL98746.1 MAG: hypothetical protein EPN73_02205 [Paraburkholderia sp.]